METPQVNSLEIWQVESMQLLNRVNCMKDKVKALILLDKHEQKWEPHLHVIIHDELYSDLTYISLTISQSLSSSDSKRYGNTLPDEILEPDWYKKERAKILSARSYLTSDVVIETLSAARREQKAAAREASDDSDEEEDSSDEDEAEQRPPPRPDSYEKDINKKAVLEVNIKHYWWKCW